MLDGKPLPKEEEEEFQREQLANIFADKMAFENLDRKITKDTATSAEFLLWEELGEKWRLNSEFERCAGDKK